MKWPQVAVFYAVVVVQMRGADAILQSGERRGDAFIHVGVSDIQTEVQLQMSLFQEINQPLGAGQLIGGIFEQYFHAARAGEQIQLLERRERGLHLALVVFFLENADVLNQVTERNDFRNIQGSLDLVEHVQPLRFYGLGNVDMRVGARSSPDFVTVHGRMQRMEFQLGIPEPMAELVDLGAIPIVQMLAGAEDLYGRHARLVDSIEPDGIQTMIDHQVGGQNVVHASISILPL